MFYLIPLVALILVCDVIVIFLKCALDVLFDSARGFNISGARVGYSV